MASDDIQGKVTDSDGNVVSGAEVYLFSQDNVGSVIKTTTDSNGNYIFKEHPDGNGTSQQWYVTTSHTDVDQFTAYGKPYVSAQINSTIPDSGAYRLKLDESIPTDEWNNNDFSKSASGVTTGVAGLDLNYPSNTAYALDGTDGDFRLGQALDLSGGWTFSIPIKLDSAVDTDDVVFETGFGSNNDYIRFRYINPDLQVDIRDAEGNDAATSVVDANVSADTTIYYQIVGFENGDIELRKGDASVVGSDTTTFNGFSNFTATTDGDIIYGFGESFSSAEHIPMTIDDPRFYFKGLSTVESSDLYNTGSI